MREPQHFWALAYAQSLDCRLIRQLELKQLTTLQEALPVNGQWRDIQSHPRSTHSANYYFERLGNSLLRMRKIAINTRPTQRFTT
jgi:hypothetical protein